MNKSKLSKYLLLSSFIGTFAESMLLPIWALLTNKVGGNVLDAGMGYALFSIVTGLVVIFVGRTKYYKANINSMVFWGFLISGIGEFSYILATKMWHIFALQCLVGLSVGLLNPAWDTLYSDESCGDAGKWSFWNGGVSFFIGVAAIVGSLIVSILGWTALFVGMGLVDFIAVIYAYKVWKFNK
jgi:hypothetical protein